MRSFLLTKLVCAACGQNLEIGDRLPTTAGQCERGEPTGADMVPTVVSVNGTPTGQATLERNAATRLAHCTFDGWLSDGKANTARSLINLFATLKAMATENEAATIAQLSQLLASPQQPAIGQAAGSVQARIGGGV